MSLLQWALADGPRWSRRVALAGDVMLRRHWAGPERPLQLVRRITLMRPRG